MGYSRIEQPSREPLELADVKMHLRVDGDAENALLGCYISAAREYAEKYTRRSFIKQKWMLALDEFPGRHHFSPWYFDRPFTGFPSQWRRKEDDPRVIRLEYGPIISIVSFSYYDTSGALQTLSANTDYQLSTTSEVEPRLLPAPGKDWPATQSQRLEAVQIVFFAGFGESPGDVPQPIRNAELLHVGTAYQNRESSIVGANSVDLPPNNTVDALLGMYRAYSFS